MARARNIKPGFFTNELLGTYEPIVTLLFAGLWCVADKEGILEDRPLRIKAELFPYREGLDVNGYLTVLERGGFLIRYEVDGIRYIQIINFEKHQHPHHTEKPRGYPKPQGKSRKQSLTPLDNGDTPSDLLIPDSLIPDSLIQDKKVAALPLWLSSNAWQDFIAHRKNIKAPMSKRAEQLALAELEKLYRLGMDTTEVINTSILNGWKGLFAPKAKNKTKDDQREECIAQLTGYRPGSREFEITGEVLQIG